ncbi:hypothetical protein NQ176_g7011 [Zarea fungicola]|uniref:Uncharacterized protein n=1 Tax=Zarea fungicola TaxID=93591 RepID=A0ACC1N089_9HYPO|nr:hypothetical protein NQ176_g7011 [Lecanicillium fungicola]
MRHHNTSPDEFPITGETAQAPNLHVSNAMVASTVVVPELHDSEEKPKEHARQKSSNEPRMAQGLGSTKEEAVQGAEGPLASFLRVLYTFSTPLDHLLRCIGLVAAVTSGAVLPCMTLVFGSSVDEFNSFGASRTSADALYSGLTRNALWFFYLFLGRYVLVYVHSSCFGISGIRATRAFRLQFVKAVIRQDITYIDSTSPGAIITTISANANMVENGITEKIGSLIQAISMLVAGFVVAFTQQWKLTLVTATTLPVLFAGFYITFALEGKILQVYNDASALVEEAMSSIRMVNALDIGKRLSLRYDTSLAEGQRLGLTKGPIIGFQYSVEMFTTYCAYSLAWFYGVKLISNGEIHSGGDMVIVLLSVLLATQAASDVAPGFSGFTRASASARAMFKIMDRTPKIDSLSDEGKTPAEAHDISIELQDAAFAYPSRPDVPILQGLSLEFEAGKTTALVGSSGSGKSTIVSLIERWFDVDSGSVLVCGHDVRDLNVGWLRNQIGLVQQEPVLFSSSIYQNVAHGLYGTPMDSLPEVDKRQLVRQACVQAFADDFIQQLPEKYDTVVGEQGQLLSGGQKQRIAIARAVVSDPRILLLDEATSALDPTAEQSVQAALDNVSKSRTTIIIAHRLSTVQKADKIVVLSKGKVLEQGSHQQLLNLKQAYFSLVNSQNLDTKEKKSDQLDNELGAEEILTKEGKELSEVESKSQAPVVVPGTGSGSANPKASSSKPKYSLICCIKDIVFKEQSHLWLLFLAGFLSSAGSGGAFPAQAVLFGESIPTLQLPPGAAIIDKGNFWALMYFVFGIGVLIVYWGVGFWWTLAAFHACRHYRREYFEAMLRQDIQFFDVQGHSASEMTSRLSTDPLHLQMLLSTNLALILLVIFNLAACCILSLMVDWELALPVIALGVPLLFGAGYFRMRMEMSNQDRVAEIYLEAARFASEAVGAIRTVSSLTLERKVLDGYEERLAQSSKIETRHKLKSMLLFAFSESITLAVSAFSFWYGGKLLSENRYDVTAFFIVFVSISMGTQSAGFMFGFTSDLSKAHSSTSDIMELCSAKPRINASTCRDGGEIDEALDEKVPAIEFRDVTFSYPNRPEIPVLRNLNLKINKGESIGIVGASGCGKSTIIGLLERFYEVQYGQILVNGKPIDAIDVRRHRSRLGLVSQDTTLYGATVRENIQLGLSPDQAAEMELQSGQVAHEAVVRACQLAHVDEFVSSLPDGYDTNIGNHGRSLSGGQRQRLAIARALIRNPDFVLLDEATSALDTENEALVQEALQSLVMGHSSQTFISVAHRLSTIKNCDRIFVLHSGQVVEEGKHEDLVGRRGRYYAMVQAQTLDKEA